MKIQKNVVMSALATLGFFVSTSATADFRFPELAPQQTVDVCVAEISGHANYVGATRVRHEVESTKRRTIGHVLRIDTRVYGETEDEVIREYATKCVVGTGEEPVSFKIRETIAGS